jgi:hypothetical protein
LRVYAAGWSSEATGLPIDSRISDWKITITDTIADNASSGAVVLGPGSQTLPTVAQLAACEATMTINGRAAGTGVGTDVQGSARHHARSRVRLTAPPPGGLGCGRGWDGARPRNTLLGDLEVQDVDQEVDDSGPVWRYASAVLCLAHSTRVLFIG